MEEIRSFLIKYKRHSIVGVIIISVLLGLGLMKKITQVLPYVIAENKWSVPTWFNPYGVAAVGFVVGVVMILLINWSFRIVLKSLVEE